MKKKIIFLMILIMALWMAGCGEETAVSTYTAGSTETAEDYVNTVEPGSGTMSAYADIDTSRYQMQVHFIDVGQGDCIFIDYGQYEALIDCGEWEYSDQVISYISQYIDGDLEMIIATHPDSDHVGGMQYIFKRFQVDCVVDSGAVKDSQTYTNYINAVNSEPNCKVYKDEDMYFDLGGGARITIIETGDGNNDVNEDSVIARLDYNEISVLLTGDMGKTVEKENLNKFSHATVLKAAHHGSRESSSTEFLSRVRPDYVIISVGAGNSYGHPHAEALRRFADVGAIVYETMNSGTIVMYTDGNTCNFTSRGSLTVTEPEENRTYDTASSYENNGDSTYSTNSVTYVGNRNTHKFHYSTCNSVNQMSENNKVYFNSRDEAVNSGYAPCGNCNP